MFSNCKNLVSVTIPKSVTKIGDSAFMKCDNLKDIYYGGSKADWKNVTLGKDNPIGGIFSKVKIHFNSR